MQDLGMEPLCCTSIRIRAFLRPPLMCGSGLYLKLNECFRTLLMPAPEQMENKSNTSGTARTPKSFVSHKLRSPAKPTTLCQFTSKAVRSSDGDVVAFGRHLVFRVAKASSPNRTILLPSLPPAQDYVDKAWASTRFMDDSLKPYSL